MPARPRPGGCGVITPPHLASPTRAALEGVLAETVRRQPGGGPVLELGCGPGELPPLFACRT